MHASPGTSGNNACLHHRRGGRGRSRPAAVEAAATTGPMRRPCICLIDGNLDASLLGRCAHPSWSAVCSGSPASSLSPTHLVTCACIRDPLLPVAIDAFPGFWLSALVVAWPVTGLERRAAAAPSLLGQRRTLTTFHARP